jgi:hypothetical protein
VHALLAEHLHRAVTSVGGDTGDPDCSHIPLGLDLE